jgi:1,4-dihydroxy-2-naphthoate octaprenyltransferase
MLALLAGFENDLTKFFWGYVIFGSAQLSVSFSNNYFDRHSDRNSVKTAFSGGSKILLENPELQFYALFISIFLLCFSIIVNLIFTVVYAYPIWFFIFVLFGGLLGWFYTAPPLKFAYRGLGELSTMLAVGFFMPGMGYFVVSGTLDSLFKLIILPLSCYGLFFIITVELPDLESDALANKKNFLVKWGRTTGKFISVLATGFGTLMLTMLFVLGIANEMIDWKPFAIFSIFPLVASITALICRTKKRKNIVKQVMVNMSSMIGFLFLIDITLFFQYTF